MKEQKYILKNARDFELKHIFECGQCFRWEKHDNGYIGVFDRNVLYVEKVKEDIIFKGICSCDIQNTCNEYFNLNTDYMEIKNKLIKLDKNIKEATLYGDGIRILKQDLWEMLISFIISANNNIPRIQRTIKRLCEKYGEKLEYSEKTFYTFPAKEQLSKATMLELREIGLGYRDRYIYETTKKILNGEVDLDNIYAKSTDEARKVLLNLTGVGRKVADCILLFGLNRYEVFPTDVWVKRAIIEDYFNRNDIQLNKIQEFANKTYGDLAGFAQQYLFYYKRGK